MVWLLALVLAVNPAWSQDEAEECDIKALEADLVDASPVAVPEVFVRIAACDAEKGKELAAGALSRTLAGDGGNAGAEAAIDVGAWGEVRTWLAGLEPDERSRTIAHLGNRCKDSESVQGWLVESHDALGEDFWRERWYRGLADCRAEGIQTLLANAIDGDVAGKGARDRHRFRGLLEVYSRNLGIHAIPKLVELCLTLEEENDIVFVVNSFADAANVGSVEGMDQETADAAIKGLEATAPKLPPKAIDQARITLEALGDPEIGDRFAFYRWPDRKTDEDLYRYMVVAVEDYTCKNKKKKAVFHHAWFTDEGRMWPEQVKELVGEKIIFEWALEDNAAKCKGEATVRIEMPEEPIHKTKHGDAWLDEQRQGFLRSVVGYDKATEEEHPAFEM